MKMFTRGQLNYLLNQLYPNIDDTISETKMRNLFEDYGDSYFRDYDLSNWVLTVENPSWKNGRGRYSWIPRAPK